MLFSSERLTFMLFAFSRLISRYLSNFFQSSSVGFLWAVLLPVWIVTTLAPTVFPSSIDHNVSLIVASWTRSLYEDGFRSITGACRVPVSYTHLRAHETRHDLVCR